MDWQQLALAILGSAGLSAAIVKALNWRVDTARAAQMDRESAANAEKLKAEAKQLAIEAASAEMSILRQVIADLREDAAEDRGKAKAVIEKLEERLEKIEERERHMLTRAAVHEAWDQLAFSFIAGHDASFPPPPPLRAHPPALPPGAAGENVDRDDN